MEKIKYLILGAGPSGLTFANQLKRNGIDSFLVIEMEKEAGGLCRSVVVDGSPLDIGGGHFLDVRKKHVNDFLFQFMPEEEWNIYQRDSRIVVNGNVINSPIEANIWQMKLEDQIAYLKSIAAAGCNVGKEKPEKFVEWIYWKLGEKIAEDYMIPYNQKMFGADLQQLGTYWLEKLPDVSFEETLRSCLTHQAYGKQPAHEKFYYPRRYGYGELWLRMADNIKEHMIYGERVKSLDYNTKTVTAGSGSSYKAEKIITTIPWTAFDEITGMQDELLQGIKLLRHSSVQIEYFPDKIDSQAHWIYYPAPKLPYHRILVRHNFCTGSRGYWTETNKERISDGDKRDNFRYMNLYAYPLNTIEKPQFLDKLLNWSAVRGVYGLGRWGEHQHYNSDVVVEKSLLLFKEILHVPFG